MQPAPAVPDGRKGQMWIRLKRPTPNHLQETGAVQDSPLKPLTGTPNPKLGEGEKMLPSSFPTWRMPRGGSRTSSSPIARGLCTDMGQEPTAGRLGVDQAAARNPSGAAQPGHPPSLKRGAVVASTVQDFARGPLALELPS